MRGGPPTLVASFYGQDYAVLLTPSAVLLPHAYLDGTMGEILSFPLGGGAPTVLATTRGVVTALLAGNDVYFADDGGIHAVPVTGGAVRTVTNQTGDLGRAGSSLVFANGSSIYSLPMAGGPVRTIASSQQQPGSPIGCGADICWLTYVPCAGVPDSSVCVTGEGESWIVRSQGALAPQTLTPAFGLGSYYLTFDGSTFYVVIGGDTSFDGSLTTMPAAGGTSRSLARANHFFVDDACIFWLDWLEGISSVAKPVGP